MMVGNPRSAAAILVTNSKISVKLTETSDIQDTDIVTRRLERNALVDALYNVIKQLAINCFCKSISCAVSFVDFQRNP